MALTGLTEELNLINGELMVQKSRICEVNSHWINRLILLCDMGCSSLVYGRANGLYLFFEAVSVNRHLFLVTN